MAVGHLMFCTVTLDPMEQMAKCHHHGKDHDPTHRGFTTLLGMSMHIYHMGEVFFSLLVFHLSFPCYVDRGFIYQLQVLIQILASR